MKLENLKLTRNGDMLIANGHLPIVPGKVTVLFGPSGAGKSTLLYALADLDPTVEMSTAQGPAPLLNQHIGLVPQQSAVFEDLGTAGRNILFARDHAAQKHSRPATDALDQAESSLGVKADWRFPMSGGQKQRVAIARALASKAAILLCDEPTSGLDPSSRKDAIAAIRAAAKEGLAVLVATHDMEWNRPDAADHAVLLKDKTLVAHPVGDPMDPAIFRPSVAAEKQPGKAASSLSAGLRLCEEIGRALWWLLLLPVQLGQGLFGKHHVNRRWLGVHILHYVRLILGASSMIYLLAGGALIGFASLYFSAGALGIQPHLQGILAPELLSGSGLGLYRVIIPLITALLVSAKCGSAVAADIGNRQYGGQIAVMRTLRANPEAHLLFSIMTVMAIGMPLLSALAFAAASGGSLAGYRLNFPDETTYSWSVYFFRLLKKDGAGWWLQGSGWNLIKLALSGAGVGLIAYRCGIQPKASHTDVGRDISGATLWGSLWCLVVFTLFAFWEF